MKIGSLFSGIGGLELGLERSIPGAHVVWQVEQNEYARAVLAKHWPQAKRFEDVRGFLKQQSLFGGPEPVDLLCGGFPCQDISTAGKRAGIDGARSGLWAEYVRIIREIEPKYVIIENVGALRSNGMGRVLGDLAACGYDAVWDCIPAQAVGAPHRRDRVFIVAWAKHARPMANPISEPAQFKREPGVFYCPSEEMGGDLSQFNTSDGGSKDAPLAHCEACGEQWCERCQQHWALCGCPGDHDGDVIDCPAEPRSRESKGLFGRSLKAVRPWPPEPSICRVADGVPRRVDRLRCLGNAVVPQVAEVIGRVVAELEGRQ